MVILRKVRRGRVKINHCWYKPNETYMEYDGKLDGQWLAFGVYNGGRNAKDFVSLWGDEAMFKAKTDDDFTKAWNQNIACINGTFPWEWGDRADTKK